jgi:hypothetical protein
MPTQNKYNILVKYPTRSRPQLFLKTLSEYIAKASDNDSIQYIISYDIDDKSMTHEVIETAMYFHPNVKVFAGHGISKIEACNRDIEKADKWDILLLISDDMECKAQGWDNLIRESMKVEYPDTDGCLWFHDGSDQRFISTLSCIGNKYYNRFGYIYHPSYKSFFCDNEYTEVAKALKKIKFIETVIVKHQHPSWGGKVQFDSLYLRNDKYWTHDENNFITRRANGYK